MRQELPVHLLRMNPVIDPLKEREASLPAAERRHLDQRRHHDQQDRHENDTVAQARR